ncbi:MAG: hypothetical protein HYV54_01470 [Parcubacteria group bacterium]|nr:hypothetical protein [Parcubacteria group bacterium]
MEHDIKQLLEKNLEISQESLRLIQKMHRAALWARFFGLLKWAIIIGGTVWGYLVIQPYLNQLLSLGNSIPQGFDVGGLLKGLGK